MSRSELLKQKILAAFGDVPRPDLSRIRQLGCCEEHDSDFDWYRQHSWQELEKEIGAPHFDRIEFFALHPVAYHYFVPGILLGTLEAIVTTKESYSLVEEDWIPNLTPRKSHVEIFEQEYLPLFTAPQRDAVASFLEFYYEWEEERQGYAVKDDDYKRELIQIWRAKT
ncbi:MAG: hypothetical protein QOG71_269 [Pyrinomonadaceae bacterium]|nr:hypothetical protein [Pyrinomonadaceae bacterium]